MSVKYACKECSPSRYFGSRKELKTHSIDHLEVKKFQCDFCLKKYSFDAVLKTHVWRKHPDLLLACKCCPDNKVFHSLERKLNHERVVALRSIAVDTSLLGRTRDNGPSEINASVEPVARAKKSDHERILQRATPKVPSFVSRARNLKKCCHPTPAHCPYCTSTVSSRTDE
jgi:hypothetical protein